MKAKRDAKWQVSRATPRVSNHLAWAASSCIGWQWRVALQHGGQCPNAPETCFEHNWWQYCKSKELPLESNDLQAGRKKRAPLGGDGGREARPVRALHVMQHANVALAHLRVRSMCADQRAQDEQAHCSPQQQRDARLSDEGDASAARDMAQCQCSNEQHNLHTRWTRRLVPRWRRRWRQRWWRPGSHNSRSRAIWDLSRRSHLRKHCQGGVGLGAFGLRLKQHGQASSSERTDAWSVGYDARPHVNQCKTLKHSENPQGIAAAC